MLSLYAGNIEEGIFFIISLFIRKRIILYLHPFIHIYIYLDFKYFQMEKLKAIFNNMIMRTLLGVIIGGIAGFAYYKLVGCRTGSCPITSNPLSSIIFGAIFGGLIASSK
jgi:hypothetical protein